MRDDLGKIKIVVEMESLTQEDLFEILLHLPYKEVLKKCQVSEAWNNICQDEVFWMRKALLDFKIAASTFYFIGESDLSNKERYKLIDSIVPTKEQIKKLNRIAPQWDPTNDGWDLVLDYPMDPNLYPDKELQGDKPMTKKEADVFLDEMVEEVDEEEEFIPYERLYLACEYSYSRHVSRKSREGLRPEVKVNQKSLVRARGKEYISIRSILEASRVFFPVDWGGIHYYRFKGFSEEGIPILKVEIGF